MEHPTVHYVKLTFLYGNGKIELTHCMKYILLYPFLVYLGPKFMISSSFFQIQLKPRFARVGKGNELKARALNEEAEFMEQNQGSTDLKNSSGRLL